MKVRKEIRETDEDNDTNEPLDKGMIRVFVYGTLKGGHSNHVLMHNSGAIFLGRDSITGLFKMYDMGTFPAVITRIDGPTAIIRGEVWAMEPEGLATLDLLEGHPHFYARRKLWTDRMNKRVWVYFLVSKFGDEATDDDEITTCIWNPNEAEQAYWGAYDHARSV